MVDDKTNMRIKRSFKNFVVLVFLLFLLKIFSYITKQSKSKVANKNSLVLQADPFDDKEDSSFDKFQRANDILHGKKDEKNLIEYDNVDNENDEIVHNGKHNEKSLIHHHHLKEPLQVNKIKEYDQKKILEEYDRVVANDSKNIKIHDKQDIADTNKEGGKQKVKEKPGELVIKKEKQKEEDLKGEKLFNQIERHDSDINNNVVMARPDLLVHTLDSNNQSLVINETNKEILTKKKFQKLLNKLHENEKKNLEHIEHHIDVAKQNFLNMDDKNGELLSNFKDANIEQKGEKLANQVERHDNNLNNDVVMARPDLFVHTFDSNNESLVINQTNREKIQNKIILEEFNDNHLKSIKNAVDLEVDDQIKNIGIDKISGIKFESQMNAPLKSKLQEVKKLKEHQIKENRNNKQANLNDHKAELKNNPEKIKIKNVNGEKRKSKKDSVRDHKHQFAIKENVKLSL